ncbi:hypothetical protein V6N12_035670 [Hibiscus sabdariffa]|uniref:GS catalytic domain-containing protein n=1 Tax=Hibiscus sabdariffa TaxID=183260 RepID=A0ABR2EQ75_9ROSI
MGFAELREAIEKIEVVDSHAHNILALDSFPLINSLSLAAGDALSFAPHSLAFKRNLREIAQLYGTESSLDAVEQYRRLSGLQAISSKCFKAAGISAILIDYGLKLDNIHDIQWHKKFVPFVGRILRIEYLAEEILNEEMPDGYTWTLDAFTLLFPHFSRCSISPTPSFGEKYLDLRLSNPLHLRTLLEDERFTSCRFVLLHASYPFSKEASYLASVYPQVKILLSIEPLSFIFKLPCSFPCNGLYFLVYLDFGLAIPRLSVHGMISSLKELLELAPLNKVMFSTDTFVTPETYYLGVKHAREVVFSVLRDSCIDHDLSITDAIEASKDMFARNAIQFYKINIGMERLDLKARESPSCMSWTNATEHSVSLVRILWVDASGQHRCRVVPKKRFDNVVKKNGVGLTFACMAMSSAIDAPADETNLTATGEIRLMPDLSTRREIPWKKQEEMVLADMHLRPGEAWEYCPRESLRRVSKVLKDEFNLAMNAGFENEFYLLKKLERDGKEEWVPIDSKSYCSSSEFDAISTLFQEIVAALNTLNVTVEQLHAEAGKGQYEMALGHTACTYAADNLIFTR